MKKTLLILALVLLAAPASAYATSVSWDFTTAGNILQPLLSGSSANVKASYFTATSTTATSTLLKTNISGPGISILGEYFTNFTNYVRSLFSAGTGIGYSGGVITNTGVTSIVAGTNITVSGATGAVTVNSTASGTISTSSPLVSGQSVYATGVNTIASVATSTITAGTNVTFTGTPGYLIGGTNLTISATGGTGGTGTVSTSTVPTVGQLSYWTSNGYPSLLGSVATGTVSSGTGISVTGGQSIIGSGLTITNTGITSNTGDWAGTWQTHAPSYFQIAGSYESPLTFNYPLSRSVNTISTVATSSLGLLVNSFASPNISQWTNNSGYLTGTKVDSFNTRTGAVTLSSADVTGALTFTPYNATNPSNYIALTALSATYPILDTAGVFSTAFGTTTANTFSALNIFNGNASTTQLTTTGSTYLATAGGNVSVGNTAPVYPFQLGANGVTGNVAWSGTGVSNPWFGIEDSGNSMYYGIAKNLPAPAGVSALGGYYYGLGVGGTTNTGANPIFGVLNSTQSANGIGNVAFTVYANNKIVTFNNTLDDGSGNTIQSGTLTVNGTGNSYFAGNVGIGTTTPGSLLSVQGVGNFTTATSTFQSTGGVNLTSGCYAIGGVCVGGGGGTGTVTSVAMTTPTGLSISGSPITTSGTLALALQSGYNIPLTASTTNWNTAYNEAVSSWTSPLQYSAGVASILQSNTSQSGYLSNSDWNTFNAKQAPLTFTYPLINTANTISTAFGTTTANSFNQLQTFTNGITANALTLASLNGPLQANNGLVSATSSIGVLYGGTGLTTAPTYGQLLLGNSVGGYNLVATSSLGLGGSAGTVTSVAASGGTTGFSFTGSPITTSGTLTLTGTLGIANGGTATTTGGVTNGVEYYNGTNLTNGSALTWNGSNTLSLTNATSNTITATKALILGSTGGTYGPTTLILENEAGANGPIFSTSGSAQNLIDFGFIPGSAGQQNIRLEARTGSSIYGTGNSGGEFQIGPAGSPNLIIGAGTTAVKVGNFGIGQMAPGSALSVNGGISAGTYSATAAPSGGMIISGNVGIGTTTPSATFSVQSATGVIREMIAGLISTTQYVFHEIDQYGHVITGGPVPTVSACGTAPVITGNDTNFRVLTGSGVITSCLVTFANSYTNPPMCNVQQETGTGFAVIASSTPTGVTISGATLTSDWFVGHCESYQ